MAEIPAIETVGLTKRFGDFTSLLDCDLTIRQGQIFGLLGPNGAGKSTLIRLIVGMLTPTAGTGTVLGADIVTQSLLVKNRTAYLPGDARLYKAMRGRQVTELFAGLRGLPDSKRSNAIADALELDLSRRVGLMSTGMKQKLAIAITLGSNAPVMILDEPTANLDPEIRRETLNQVVRARDEGSTILLSSHLFSDIDGTCDEVAVLRAGQIIAREQLRGDNTTRVVNFTAKSEGAITKLIELCGFDSAGSAIKESADALPDNSSGTQSRELTLAPSVTGIVRAEENGRLRVTLYCESESYRVVQSICQLGEDGTIDELSVRTVGVEAIYDRAIQAAVLSDSSDVIDTPSSAAAQ